MISERKKDELDLIAQQKAKRLFEKWKNVYYGERLNYGTGQGDEGIGLPAEAGDLEVEVPQGEDTDQLYPA